MILKGPYLTDSRPRVILSNCTLELVEENITYDTNALADAKRVIIIGYDAYGQPRAIVGKDVKKG